MTAIFKPEGPLFRATEHAGGPWSPDMLQGSATTALMTREVERLANASRFAVRWSRYFQNVSVRLIEGALEKPGPAAAWMRIDVPMVEGEANTPLLQAVQAADFSSGVAQIVDMREWTFINPEISLYFFRQPVGEWILIRSRTRVGDAGAGLTMATLSDRQGPFAEVMRAMTFERREAQARAS